MTYKVGDRVKIVKYGTNHNAVYINKTGDVIEIVDGGLLT